MFDEEKSLIFWKKKVYQLVFALLWLAFVVFVFNATRTFAGIFVCFFISILINYLLSPMVDFFERVFWGLRWLAILFILLLFLFFLVLLFVNIVPTIVNQFTALKLALPSLVTHAEIMLIQSNNFLEQFNIQLPIQTLNKIELITTFRSVLSNFDYDSYSSYISNFVLGSISALLYLVLTLIFSFYLLADGEQILDMVIAPFSKRARMHIRMLKEKIDLSLRSFIVGQFFIALATSTVMLATYLVLDVQYAFVLATLQMLEIVPVLGTWIAIVPCILVIAFSGGISKAAIALVVYLIYTQVFRDPIVAPRILGTAMGLHPIAVVFAMFIGVTTCGATGVVLAIPVLAIVLAVIGYWMELRRFKVDS